MQPFRFGPSAFPRIRRATLETTEPLDRSEDRTAGRALQRPPPVSEAAPADDIGNISHLPRELRHSDRRPDGPLSSRRITAQRVRRNIAR